MFTPRSRFAATKARNGKNMQSNDNVIALTRPAAYPAEILGTSPVMPPQVSLNIAASDDDGAVAFVTLMQRFIDPAIAFGMLAATAQFFGPGVGAQYIAFGVIAALLTILLFKPAIGDQLWLESSVIGLAGNVFGSWTMLLGILMLIGV